MNDDFLKDFSCEVSFRLNRINSLVSHIKHCNDELQLIQSDKMKSEKELREIFDHPADACVTYDAYNHKITISTGYNYKFDKRAYLELLSAPEKINPKFQIVKEVTSLELNKKAIRDCDEFGSDQDRYLKSLFITATDKKLHVAIKSIKDAE